MGMNEPEIFRYAQIDLETGKCVSVSYLAGEEIADHMIRIAADLDIKIGDIYVNGVWNPSPPPPPRPPTADQIRIAQLEAENTDLKSRMDDMEMFAAEIISGGGV